MSLLPRFFDSEGIIHKKRKYVYLFMTFNIMDNNCVEVFFIPPTVPVLLAPRTYNIDFRILFTSTASVFETWAAISGFSEKKGPNFDFENPWTSFVVGNR
jgi:hypothetical protein